MAAFGADDDCLLDTREESVYYGGTHFVILPANLSERHFWVWTNKDFTFFCLLVLKLLKKPHHEFVWVVLGYWVEFAANKFFQLRINNPVFVLWGLTKHCRVKQIKLLAALKVKFARVFALKLNVVLVDKVVPQRLNRQQTLQTRIHVAEERIVMQTYNPVFKVLIRLLPRDLDDLSRIALGFCVWPALRVLRCLLYFN